MCACVGNQRSHAVVIARLQSTVQNLLHECRDLHQSTYLYLAEDRDLTSYQDFTTDLPVRSLTPTREDPNIEPSLPGAFAT
jgi:hypothetical protein